MIKLSKDKVLLLHQLIAEETGGSIGIRDTGLLESALNNAYATFDGEYLYRTKEEKAASLGYYLISNHEELFPLYFYIIPIVLILVQYMKLY